MTIAINRHTKMVIVINSSRGAVWSTCDWALQLSVVVARDPARDRVLRLRARSS